MESHSQSLCEYFHSRALEQVGGFSNTRKVFDRHHEVEGVLRVYVSKEPNYATSSFPLPPQSIPNLEKDECLRKSGEERAKMRG